MALPTGTAERARRFEETWRVPRGIHGWFATVNNTSIGARYMVTSLAFFLIAGVMGLFIRTQLIVPENTFLDPETFNQLFTMHGATMMFLFVIPFLEGFANFILPSMLGARDLAYPRVTAFGYWLYLFGGVIFFSSFLIAAVPDAGWFAYPPLSNADFSGLGMDFFLLGLGAIELGGLATGIELVVSILKLRAPGMTLGRMPLLAWAFLVMGFMIAFAFTVLLVATLLLELDRGLGTRFFDPTGGGNPLLWQHLFWIFGHPEVYIMFIPATGIVSMIVPTFARRPIAAYLLIVLAIVVTGFVSFGLWAHHMFTAGLPLLASGFFTAASFLIALATGTQIFAWIATLWGSRPSFRTPMLFVVGFIVIFMLGGVTGVMVASVPFNAQVHDTYFVVAHFHYVLIGGVIFPIFGGLYYWMPQIAGRVLDERLGAWNFWLMFIGFNLAFFPMHISGMLGMPRRVYTYQDGLGLGGYNLASTIGAYLLGVGFLLFFVNFLVSRRSERRPPQNQWGAGTLEWAVDQPTPNYNFRMPPVVRSRYPLWQQQDLEQAGEPEHGVVAELDAEPSSYRATLVTSVVGAEPQSLWVLSGPSYVPILTAVGVTLVALGPLIQMYWLMAAGAVLGAAGLASWLWPDRNEREQALHDELNERLGLPLVARGQAEPGWWGVVSFIVVAAVAYGIMVFSYAYIGLYSPEWPQGGIPRPELLRPGVAAALLVGSAATALWGARAIRRGERRSLTSGLVATLVLGAGFLALHAWDLLEIGFAPQVNAYASLFWVIAGLVALTALIGLGLLLGVLIRTLRGHFDQQFNTAVQHTVMVWQFVVVAGIGALAVLYLAPHLF